MEIVKTLMRYARGLGLVVGTIFKVLWQIVEGVATGMGKGDKPKPKAKKKKRRKKK